MLMIGPWHHLVANSLHHRLSAHCRLRPYIQRWTEAAQPWVQSWVLEVVKMKSFAHFLLKMHFWGFKRVTFPITHHRSLHFQEHWGWHLDIAHHCSHTHTYYCLHCIHPCLVQCTVPLPTYRSLMSPGLCVCVCVFVCAVLQSGEMFL